MCFRVTRRLTTFIPVQPYRPIAHLPKQSQFRFASYRYNSTRNIGQRYKSIYNGVHSGKHSNVSFATVVIVVTLAISGALLYPRGQPKSAQHSLEEDSLKAPAPLDPSEYEESYLVMAPGTPPGRPGTLTPDQEVKLRELWALTLKVFGVYEGASASESTESARAPSLELASPDAGEKKKKSRLRVFSRNKDKSKDSESETTSASATPSDISRLSLAEEDDKHGLNKDFKAALQNQSPEDLRKAFWDMVKHDHPDALLLRFLRARKWDVEKALIMMISTMHWRMAEMHVDDDVIRRGELAMLEESKSSDHKLKKEGEDFLAQMRMGKSYLHGTDKEGRPMCVVRVKLHRQGEQSEQSLERFTVYTIETARMMLRPPVDTATVIFDMTGFSMANMDYTPVKFMIKCFEANYPESLGAVLVHKAPWVFQGIWKIIRGWLDPVVAGKVHFTSDDKDLAEFIPRDHIPSGLGGDEKWEYEYIEPDQSENALHADTEERDRIKATRTELVRKYERVVLGWIHSADEKDKEKIMTLDEVRAERDTIAEDLRKNYWELDPFVRAKTLYDRTGIIQEGGKLEFYPHKTKENALANPAAAAQKPAAVEHSADDVD